MLPRLLWVVEQTAWRPIFEQPVKAESLLAHGPKRRVGEGEVAVLSGKKDKSQISRSILEFLIIASIVGFALIPVLVVQPNLEPFQLSNGYSIVGALFTAICLLGIAAVFIPAKCMGIFQKTQRQLPQTNVPFNPIPRKGHHPDCPNFAANRITVGGRVFCAACSGLLIGAIIALLGTAIHFFVGLNLALGSVWMVVFGEIWMLLGLAQIKFAGYVKVATNMMFVVGSFVALVEADWMGKSLLLDLYVIGLIGFVLWLRVLLSEWNNRRVCQTCGSCFC